MVALTEIIGTPLEYDSMAERVREKYLLRNVFVNPNYVVSFKEKEVLIEKSKKGTLVEGISPSVSFTQLTLTSSCHGMIKIDVVGSLEQIAEKFNGG